MGKSYSGTPEFAALLRECAKYPVGTKASIISHGIFDGNNPIADLLHQAGRTSGANGIHAVYKQLTKMVKDATTLAEINQIRIDLSQMQSQTSPIVPPIQVQINPPTHMKMLEVTIYKLNEVQENLEFIKSRLS